jgi:type II secretory pathway pseudopilin PulG
MISNKIESKKSNAGFTIIEMVVSMAIFLLVVAVVVTIFLSIIVHQRRVLSEQQLLNQISYVEEYMSKALRMAKRATSSDGCIPDGYIYQLTKPDVQTGYYTGIKFINASADGVCQEFFFDEDGILKELKDSTNINDAVPLTSEKVQMDMVRFSINGTSGCYNPTGSDCPDSAQRIDGIQPRVTILMTVKIAGETQEPVRTLQTTVSQRNLNTSD